MNDNAIYNFDLDIQFLEDFVQGLGDPNVADAFLELRQVYFNERLLFLNHIIDYIETASGLTSPIGYHMLW